MQVTLKRTVLLVILAFALLLSLVGWTVRMMTVPAAPNHIGVHSSSHVTAFYCPPPPRNC